MHFPVEHYEKVYNVYVITNKCYYITIDTILLTVLTTAHNHITVLHAKELLVIPDGFSHNHNISPVFQISCFLNMH